MKTITATNVTLNANGQIGSSNTNGIDIAATNLRVNTSGNANAFVRTGAINMGVGTSGSSVGTGTLDLTATGAVTQTASTGNITAGTLNVKTLANAGAAITLTNDGNDAATVNLQARTASGVANATAAISYTDANAVVISGINNGTGTAAGTVTLLAGGALTQSGAIKASALTATTANDAGAAITLTNTGNDAVTVNLQARKGSVSAVGNDNANAAISYTDANAVDTTGINNGTGAAGDVTLLAGGLLRQTSTGIINASTLTATTASASAGANINFSLNANNNAERVNLQARNGSVTGVGTANANAVVSYTDLNAVEITGINNGTGTAGDVILRAGGELTQTGAIKSNTLTATTAFFPTGADLTLTHTGNDAVTVNLNTRDGAGGNANKAIRYTDATGFAIGTINNGNGTAAGNVTLLAGGAITQTGAIKASTLTVTTANDAGTAITLSNTGNDATNVNLQARNGSVAAVGTANVNAAISYTDATGFAISGINNGTGAGGNVTLAAGGTVTQTGAVNAAQLSATLTGTASALNLGTQTNNIAQLNAITAPGGFTLNNGNNSVNVAGTISTNNNSVFIDAGTGSYTQNTNIDVSAGTGNITVVADTVAIATNTGNNAFATTGTLALKPKTLDQEMSLAGSSAISPFDLSAAEITAISEGANSIVIGDAASTGLLTIAGAVNLTGKSLTLNAGSITDTDVKTITATNVTLKANNGAIGSSITDGIDIAATNLSVNTSGNANAFVRTGAIKMGVGTSGSSVGTGTLDLTATGAVTQTASTGNITAGTLNVKTLADAGAGITLTNSANDVAVVNLQTRNLADTANATGAILYADATGFDVATIATTSNVTLAATGAVTQTGAIAATGLALTGTGGAYTLNHESNAITTLAANTGSVSYKQSGSLAVGTVGAVSGFSTTGTTRIETTGAAANLTLNNAVTSGATGDAIILKAGSGNPAGEPTGGQLINNVGPGGIVASSTSGRYLVYSGDPGLTTEGVSGYAKRYNANATFVPSGTASTFFYRIAPTLAITANAGSKVYDGAAPTLTFGTAGLIDGDTAGTALTGALTRSGGKNVLGGDAVTIGTLAAQMGYGITYTGANHTITAKSANVNATANSTTYNGATQTQAAVTASGFITGDSITVSGLASGKNANTYASNLAVGGTDASNYTVTITNADLVIGKANATVTASSNTALTYNGANQTVSGFSASGLQGGEAASVLTSVLAATTNKNAGTYSTSASGTDGNYNLSFVNGSMVIAKANATVTANSNTALTYSGVDQTVTGFSASGLQGGETASVLTGVSASTTNKNAGTYSTSASGTDGNYNLSFVNGSMVIAKAALTVTAAQVSKTYDGTTSASGSAAVGTLAGAGAGESVSTAASQVFTNKNAGTANKTVRASGLAIQDSDGADVTGNYSITYTDNTSSTISKTALTVTAAQVSKTYDGTTSAAGNAAVGTLAGAGAGESVSTAASLAFDGKGVGDGNKTVRATGLKIKDSDGADVTGNYSISYTDNTSSTISKLAITLSGITAVNKTYDGTKAATVSTTAAVFSNKVTGDELTVSSTGSFADKTAATGKTVTLSNTLGGADLQNYSISQQTTASADISKLAITVSGITASNKTYDGSTAVTVSSAAAVFSNKVTGDELTVSSTGSFADKTAATGKTVTLANTLGGADLDNYSISQQTTASADIEKAIATVKATANSTTYSGATQTQAAATSSGFITGDTITVSGLASGKDANTYASNLAVGGTDATNYSVTITNADLVIAKANLSQVTASKTYDGLSTVTAAQITAIKGVSGESFTTSAGTAAISDKNVVTASKTLTDLSGLTLTGVNGGLISNYNLTSGLPAASTNNAVTITAKTLSASLVAQTKTYNGNNTASWTSGTITASGFASGESASVTQTSGTYNDKNVVGASSVTATLAITDFSFTGGGLASNYTLPTSVSASGSINKANLTVSGITASDKTYDGKTSATAFTRDASYSGLIGTDSVVVSSIGIFADKNAGIAKTVNLFNNYSGADVDNYAIIGQNTTTAAINRKALTISDTTAAGKTYDGNTTAAITVGRLSGFVDGEAVSATARGTFDSKNAGIRTATAIYTLTDGGGLAENYTLADTTHSATISKVALTYTANKASFNTGTTPASLSGTVSGFVNNESQSSATTGTLAWTTPATSASGAGNYAINGSGLSAVNYSFIQAVDNATALTLTQSVSIVPVVNPPSLSSDTSFAKSAQLARTTAPLIVAENINTLPATSAGSVQSNGPTVTKAFGSSGLLYAQGNGVNLPTDFYNVNPADPAKSP